MPPVRIVIFGPPRTGKSRLIESLLADFAARPILAAPSAPPEPSSLDALNFVPLVPLTQSEVVPYFSPGIVLYDVDGKSASKLLAEPASLAHLSGPTAAELQSANAAILVLDASANVDERLRLYREFGRFLESLERSRADNRDVGGLPVFLTITKCDLLATPADDPAEWESRVSAKLDTVRTTFEDYLDEETEATDPYTFGKIRVFLHATAMEFPKRSDFASLAGPYGIEELSDQLRAEARSHRSRSELSQSRLRWTLIGSGVLFGTMLLLLISLLLLAPDGAADRFLRQVEDYQQREGSAAVRLSERQLVKNQREIDAMLESPLVETLPPDLQGYLESRRREFAEYTKYRDQFRPPQISPPGVRSRRDFEQLDADLAGPLAPPAEYAEAWTDTESAQLWKKWKQDTSLLRVAEAGLSEWYRNLIRRGTVLVLGPTLDGRWRSDVGLLVAESDKPPFDPAATIPGSEALPIRRGAALLYAPAFEIDRVDQARGDWDSTRERLLTLRDLADALGRTSADVSRPAIFDWPEPRDAGASEQLMREWPSAFAMLYPRAAADPKLWLSSRFPDPLRQELQLSLRRTYATGIRHLQFVILSRLGAGASGFRETPESWNAVKPWLADPVAVGFGDLLVTIARWADPDQVHENPTTELATFLDRAKFDADLSMLELYLPDNLKDERLLPAGKLLVEYQRGTEPKVELVYQPALETERTANGLRVKYTLETGTGRVSFRPGDAVQATTTVKAAGREYRLEWTRGPSLVYQFGRLSREPWLRLNEQNSPQERGTGIRLSAMPETGLPMVPAALPLVSERGASVP